MTDRWIMKHPCLALSAGLLAFILCQQHIYSMYVFRSSQWAKSRSKILLNITPVTARSRVQCAGLCVAEVRCVGFCHNSVTLACFLDLGVSSDFGQESTDGRKCFTRIKGKLNGCVRIDLVYFRFTDNHYWTTS